MFKQFLRRNWYVIAIAAAIGIFMTIATTVIWPANQPTIINRIGVATLYRDGETYYCFQLREDQYNNTVFPSAFWGDREVVLVPAPSNYEDVVTSNDEPLEIHPQFIIVPSGFNQTTIKVK